MGQIVRKTKNGKFIGWYVRFKDSDGQRRQRATHQPSQAEARRYLVEVEARIARGLIGVPEPPPPVPRVAEIMERFLVEYQRPKLKNIVKYRMRARTAFRRALPLIGTCPGDRVDVRLVSQLLAHLMSNLAPNTVRMTLAQLGAMFAWAYKLDIIPSNPLKAVELPPRTQLVEYLSQDEVSRLLELGRQRAAPGTLADKMLSAMVTFALHTGLRKGELLGLRWIDVDPKTRRLTVAKSFRSTPKSGKTRHLRLPSALIETLTEWAKVCPRMIDGLVFPVVNRKPRMGKPHELLGLDTLLADADCKPMQRPWHALRHTFASQFVMAGGNILTLQRILGHQDINMTLVYAHLAPDFLGDEMDRVKLR